MFGRVPNIRASVLRAVADAGSGLTWSEWEMTGSTPATEGPASADPCRGCEQA